MPSVKKMPENSEQKSQPNVILDILFESGLLFISIHNIDSLPAHHVRIDFDQPIPGMDGQPVNDLNVFKLLEYLPPGKALKIFLNRADLYFQAESPTRFEVTVKFQDDQKNNYHNKIKHDVSIYEDIHIFTADQKPGASQADPLTPPQKKPPLKSHVKTMPDSLRGTTGSRPGGGQDIGPSSGIENPGRTRPTFRPGDRTRKD